MNNPKGYKKQKELKKEEAIYFLASFRDARANTLKDSENFKDIIIAIENFGCFLGNNSLNGFSNYKCIIKEFVRKFLCDYETEFFETKYEIVRTTRNESIHSGVFARNVSTHSLELLLIIEEALLSFMSRTSSTVGSFMINNVIVVQPWHTVKIVRNIMLTNSFTHIPVYHKDDWYLVSETDIIIFLGVNFSDSSRKHNSVKTIQELIESLAYKHQKVTCKHENEPLEEIKKEFIDNNGRPVLIVHSSKKEQLLGIITPYDIL